MRVNHLNVFVGVAVSVFGCGPAELSDFDDRLWVDSGNPSPENITADGGSQSFDAGMPQDAGPRPDAGSLVDAGPKPDAGSKPDAGQPVDSGTTGPYYIYPSGADDTAALTAAVKAHSKVVISQALIINGIVDLTGVSNKTLEWVGAGQLRRTTTPTPDSIFVISLNAATNVKLIKPVIKGAWTSCAYSAPVEHHHAVHITGASSYITIEGGSFTNMPGDGVYIARASHHITVNALTVNCVGRNAISNVGSTVVRVNGGSYSNAGLWIFNIEPTGTKFVDDYVITTPTVGPSGSYWLLSTGPDFSCKVTKVVVHKPVFARPSKATNIASCVASGITINY